jgi:hypothetical protein
MEHNLYHAIIGLETREKCPSEFYIRHPMNKVVKQYIKLSHPIWVQLSKLLMLIDQNDKITTNVTYSDNAKQIGCDCHCKSKCRVTTNNLYSSDYIFIRL